MKRTLDLCWTPTLHHASQPSHMHDRTCGLLSAHDDIRSPIITVLPVVPDGRMIWSSGMSASKRPARNGISSLVPVGCSALRSSSRQAALTCR
jgi:hypothetical protein